MPYTASNGTCRTITNHPYKLTNWYSIAGNTIPSVDQIKNAISTYGPVAAAICVGPGFSGYRSGVFSTNESSSCTSTVNHAIVLTGWDDTTQSWVLRNSWGPNWGEAGYMRIKWGTSNVGYAANYVVFNAGATPTPGGPTATNTPVPQVPANDDLNTPVVISLANNVFTANQNITAATTASDDPVFACVAGKGYRSVWYRYTATQSGSININTTGSEYDTILGVWQGSRGALSSIACNDDVAPGQTQSQVNLNVTSGQVYYIEAAGYYSYASGLLYITLSYTPAATSTFTPTASFTPTSTRTNTPTRTSTPTMTPRSPVGYGTYDDKDTNILFTGSWKAQLVTGMYSGTEHKSLTIGSSAILRFTGNSVTLRFRKHPYFGNMVVKIDGVTVATVNQYSSSIVINNYWTSPQVDPSIQHNIEFIHSTGTNNSLDAIIVNGPPTVTPSLTSTKTPTQTPTYTPTPAAVSVGTYDDKDTNILFSGSWKAQLVTGMYSGTEHKSLTIGSSAILRFTGNSVTLRFRKHPYFGNMVVKIDGVTVATVNQYSSSIVINNYWTSPQVDPSIQHNIEFIHSTGTNNSLDAIIVNGPPTVTPSLTSIKTPTQTPTYTPTPAAVSVGTYDDKDTNILFSGSWKAQLVTGMYSGTEHKSLTIGSSAILRFTGNSVTLRFRKHPYFGNMVVKIDGVTVATVNQYSSSIVINNYWTSPQVDPSIQHNIEFIHSTGTNNSLDAIIVN